MGRIRKDNHCIKCKNILDRKGNICQRCFLKSKLKGRQRATRDNRQATIQLKEMEKSIYDKMFKEINDELDEEEKNKKQNGK